MKGIILAAGRGSRMKNLTENNLKCLVELHGKSLLDIQIETLKSAGVTEIGIVTGYKKNLLSDRKLTQFHNKRWKETNMVFSLTCADDWLVSEPCIVSYSDIFYGTDAVNSLIYSNESLAITYDPNWLKLWQKRFSDPLVDAETFRLTSENKLAEIGKKPKIIDEIEGQYMGLLRFTPKGWAEVLKVLSNLKKHESDMIQMTQALQKVIESNNVLIDALPYEGKWGEIDSQEDLWLYQNRN